MTRNTSPSPQVPASDSAESTWASLISVAGYILAVAYPVLALSTGARAGYQILFKEGGVVFHLPSVLSLVATLVYLAVSFGFAYRRPWTWWLSLGALAFELAMVLAVGIWSMVDPPFIGRTVWRLFGQDYGFFPLFLPVVGLVWLLWPPTRALYGTAFPHAEAQRRRERQ
jgi:hypothetical protein